ncbi:response regulator [Methylobacterium pseudosasicola]|uniref:Response regulator receiver domain-containing protein n=1 Tax=Methylobacterium pseudosasicola TaxID=582667 RepID=A0A1I4SAI0_9HYPH|nr:response regulator [Methylobacterium pseudosasicola]SFM61273.1 Response regulator receiver domain-containing protein [Methylobacterium pseudosasicola]
MTEPLRPGQALVLVVEDDPILMMSLVDFVENAGCEAIEVSTVVEAIQILETRHDIRTVFTDLDMRGSTAGMQLALSIRDRWPPIELLMVSSQPWDTSQIPARGVVLGKPFDRRKIEAALRKFAA